MAALALSCAALGFALPPAAPLAAATASRGRAHAPVAFLPPLPVLVPSLAVGAVIGVLSVRRSARERAAFFDMEWAEAAAVDEGDGCVLIGEEKAEAGKAWFVCSDKSSDLDCEPVQRGIGVEGEEYLCKAPKAA
jgi:hypothetical protein